MLERKTPTVEYVNIHDSMTNHSLYERLDVVINTSSVHRKQYPALSVLQCEVFEHFTKKFANEYVLISFCFTKWLSYCY